VHGLSLVLFTLLMAALVIYFAVAQRPVRCRCADQTVQEAKRSLVERSKESCEAICALHGGRAPK
jgi:hypothetical protein